MSWHLLQDQVFGRDICNKLSLDVISKAKILAVALAALAYRVFHQIKREHKDMVYAYKLTRNHDALFDLVLQLANAEIA